MKICVLGSGSSGNSIHVGCGNTRILVDAGLSGRETLRRIELAGGDPSALDAICLTHEHGDHTAGLGALVKRLKPKLYANSATVEAVEQALECKDWPWQVFTPGFKFEIGDIAVEPFSVCHDARDPVGFVLQHGDVKIGIVTDMGTATVLVRERLKDCRVLVIEANHDEGLLRDSKRPWSLKQRIAGRQGHLSNKCAAELVAEVAGPKLSHVFLVHLSEECNRPGMACEAVQRKLNGAGLREVKVLPTFPDRPSEVWCDGEGDQ